MATSSTTSAVRIHGLSEQVARNDSIQLLKVRVVEARGLAKPNGSKDAYVKVILLSDASDNASSIDEVKTPIIRKTSSPKWDVEYVFRVDSSKNKLVLQVYHEARLGKDDLLGLVEVVLSETHIDNDRMPVLPIAHILRPKRGSRAKGHIYVALAYVSQQSPSTNGSGPTAPSLSGAPPAPIAATPNGSTVVTLTPAPTPNSTSNGGQADSQRDHIGSTVSSVPLLPTPGPPGASRTSSVTGASGSETGGTPTTGLSRQASSTNASASNESEPPLPANWSMRRTPSGRTYYVNHQARTTQWERPTNANGQVPLPNGWEQRVDPAGRVYYVDHNTRRTQWDRPTAPSAPVTSAAPGSQPAATAAPTATQQQAQADAAAADLRRLAEQYRTRHQISHEDTVSRTISVDDMLSTLPEHPAPVLHSLPGPQRSPSPGTTRSRPSPAPPTQSSRSSVTNSNQRSLLEEEQLPAGWTQAVAANGRIFYIDHNTRTTSWNDPRTGTPSPVPNSANNPARQSIGKASTPDGSGTANVGNRSTLNRSSSDEDLLSTLGPLPPGWEERQHSDGRTFYIDHTNRVTTWDDPRLKRLGGPAVPYSRDFKQKNDYFRSKLRKPTNIPNKYDIRVRRARVLEDSYTVIMGCKKPDLMKARLWIIFDGEAGLDYGGVAREWFFLLSREMFNPYYGLFEYSALDNYTLQINPLSGLANPDHLNWFHFIGRIAGLAVYHGKLLDGFFIRPFYKMMLGKKLALRDLETVDPDYVNSLKWISENDPADLCLTFSVNEETFGTLVEHELKPGGKQISVTEQNKREYIELIVNWKFVNRVQEQMTHFMKGFQEFVPLPLFQIFDENEVELLLCGLTVINVDDWKAHTNYKGEYTANHPVIVNFWRAVYSFNNELRARLLQFVTGTSRIPMNGFSELWGSNGPQRFTIEKWGTVEQLPRAHTCFNRLDLPAYREYKELRKKLLIAIENTEGFEGVD